MNSIKFCYCGNNISFDNCCRKFLDEKDKATTAEELMRSRYSAFCLGYVDYLVNSLIATKRHPNEAELIQHSIDNNKWIGLKILKRFEGQKHHQTGEVEFTAFFYDKEEPNKIKQIHEKSSFKKVNEIWYYVDGIHLKPIKIGRNDLCFCNSEKKFKKCHGFILKESQ